jgi:diguanylate cyclase (GGDEF)-like protein/PAS domain S-box-containing protein
VGLCRRVLEKIIQTGQKQVNIQYRVKHKDGHWRWHESNASPLKDYNGRITAFLGIARDITATKELEESLYKSNELLENLLMELPVAIMIVDYKTRQILELNPKAMSMLGYSGDQVIGSKCTDFVCPADIGKCPIIDQGMEINHSEREIINSAGRRLPIHKSAIVMDLDGRKVILECFTDISRIKEMEHRLQEMARTDDLTGLFNRRYFMEQAKREISRAKRYNRPVSMIEFDLDHFKNVNDHYGHPAGDEVLRSVASRTREILRKNDFAARLGGEEFGIILPETDIISASALAERLRRDIEDHVCVFEGQSIRCTLSLGAAQWEGPGEDLDALMRRTDKALYRAKNAGRNQFCSESGES